jgi:YD repeat-containing protein
VIAYYTHDAAGRVKQLENRGPAWSTLINYFAYERNALGAPTWIRHEGGENTYYEYDTLDRLTLDERKSSSASLYGFRYAYDVAGNRARKSQFTGTPAETYYTYDALDLLTRERVLGVGTMYYAYDRAQRMTSQRTNVSGGQSAYFTHDQRDQATRLDFAKASSPDQTRTFLFNGVGERVRETTLDSGGLIDEQYQFSYDGTKLIRERLFDPDPNAVNRYRHNDQPDLGRGSIVELQDSAGVKTYPVMDDRGSLLRVAEGSDGPGGGSLENKYYFDAFGNTLATVERTVADPRLRFVTEVFLRLGLTNHELLLTPGGIYLPMAALSTLRIATALVISPWLMNDWWRQDPHVPAPDETERNRPVPWNPGHGPRTRRNPPPFFQCCRDVNIAIRPHLPLLENEGTFFTVFFDITVTGKLLSRCDFQQLVRTTVTAKNLDLSPVTTEQLLARLRRAQQSESHMSAVRADQPAERFGVDTNGARTPMPGSPYTRRDHHATTTEAGPNPRLFADPAFVAGLWHEHTEMKDQIICRHTNQIVYEKAWGYRWTNDNLQLPKQPGLADGRQGQGGGRFYDVVNIEGRLPGG